MKNNNRLHDTRTRCILCDNVVYVRSDRYCEECQLKETPVVVNVEERYSDNNGAYDVVSYWDGLEITTETLTGNTDKITPSVNATNFQKHEAAYWYKANIQKETSKAIGHKFIVGGSRKIAKGVIVELLSYNVGGYDSRFNNYVSDSVTVKTEQGETYNISTNCLKTWVEGTLPYWGEV